MGQAGLVATNQSTALQDEKSVAVGTLLLFWDAAHKTTTDS